MEKKILLRGARAAASVKVSVLSGFRLVPSPLFMVWEATRACNLRCSPCYMDRAGFGLDDGGSGAAPLGADALLGAEEMKKIVMDAARLGLFCLVVTGGEPLLREDIFEVRAYASSLGLFVSLTTNGTLIDETTIGEVSRFDHVAISVDPAHEASFRSAVPTGRPYGSFIDDLIRRLKGRSPRPIVNVQSVIDEGTWERLLDINARFYDLGIDAVFQLRYGAAFRIDPERWKAMLGRMRFRSRPLGWIQRKWLALFPAIARGASSAPCLALTSNVVVSPEGRLLPCNFRRGDLADLRGGAGFEETWKNLGAARRRFASRERGCACANTCFLPAAMLLQ